MSKENQENSGNEGGLLNRLSIITDNLNTYPGRDTVITLWLYVALIIADVCAYNSAYNCAPLSDNYIQMSIVLSDCRVMLRLFDDWDAVRNMYRFLKSPEQVLVVFETLNLI